MIAAPIPVDDAERLEALRALNLLDTPPEERFDRITRLLTLVFRVPLASISLVDSDRLWFKSSCGLDTNQISRAVSFCGHALLSDEPMVVPDAAEDVRFHDNPLVTGEPNIRFYAGHPLAGPGGQKVGTLGIADRRPRSLDESELATLREMARIVERELGLVEAVHLQRNLIRAEQRAKEAEHQRAESLGRLVESQRHLLHELTEAAKYVRSLLPEPLDGPVRTRWRFEPSSHLGGDFFGYDWVDRDHFAAYLLDVSGHGVGAALLSASVANALRGRSLPNTDFRDPGSVLARLNDAFPMERHDEKYFTIWYAVFDRVGRTLSYASAGHPPALLLTGPAHNRARAKELGRGNLAIGMLPNVVFSSTRVALEPYSKLCVFSDGVYEIHRPGGTMMKLSELLTYLSSPHGPSDPDEVWRFIRREGGTEPLKDDFSLLEIQFG
jgi:sigma-B regulation protein RsbU (phosphoserine phosphatase)